MKKFERVLAAPRVAVVAAAVVISLALGGTAVAAGGFSPAASDTSASPTTSSAGAAATTATSSATDQAAGSGGSSGNNQAVAVNTHDDSYRYAISLKVVQLAGDTVDPSNAAAAVSSCSDCQTVAISLEGVLVYGDPSVFAPTNLALAYNVNCTNCATLAAAYQVEQQYLQRSRITGAGRVEIARIRRDLEAIRQDKSLTLSQIDARVNEDAAALLQVLRTQVVPVGKPQADRSAFAATASPDSATPSASPPADSPSPSAGQTASPDPSPSPAAEATETPSPSPSS